MKGRLCNPVTNQNIRNKKLKRKKKEKKKPTHMCMVKMKLSHHAVTLFLHPHVYSYQK